MQEFKVILKNEKQKSYHTMAVMMLFLNLSAFIFLGFVGDPTAISGLAGISGYVLYRLFVKRKYKQGFFFDEFAFFIPAVAWLAGHHYIIGAIALLLGLLYKVALQKLALVFTDQGVVKANFPRRELSWDSFSNVVLKDGMLTLDFKNNKLFQAEVEKGQDINEANFNRFVQSKVA